MQAPPFFRALNALAVDDGGGGRSLALRAFAAFDVEGVEDAVERAVSTPQTEISMQRRTGRQIFRDCSPLTTGTENIHEPVDDLALVHPAPFAAALGGRNKRPKPIPSLVGDIAGIAHPTAVVAGTIFVRPHFEAAPRLIRPPSLSHKRFL